MLEWAKRPIFPLFVWIPTNPPRIPHTVRQSTQVSVRGAIEIAWSSRLPGKAWRIAGPLGFGRVVQGGTY